MSEIACRDGRSPLPRSPFKEIRDETTKNYGIMRKLNHLGSAAILIASLAGAGCENAGQGAVSGGAIGALGGLAIGSLTGSVGAGAAIGAISGAVAGGVIGDQNRRAAEQQQNMRSQEGGAK